MLLKIFLQLKLGHKMGRETKSLMCLPKKAIKSERDGELKRGSDRVVMISHLR